MSKWSGISIQALCLCLELSIRTTHSSYMRLCSCSTPNQEWNSSLVTCYIEGTRYIGVNIHSTWSDLGSDSTIGVILASQFHPKVSFKNLARRTVERMNPTMSFRHFPWNPLRRTISNLIIIHVDTRDHSSSESSTSEREVSETPYRATTISITLADRADQGLRLAVPHIIIYERHSRRVFETRLFESATRHGAKFSPSSCHATRMHRKPIYSLLRRSYHRYAVTRAAYHHHSCSLFSQSAPLGVCAHPHPRACW